jgi:PmbA protein
MFWQIAGVGTDTLVRGTRRTGSILIESMTVAGG